MRSSFLPETVDRRARKVHYPTRDGKPIGETDAHIDLVVETKIALRNYYFGNPDVYVSAANFIYFEEGNSKARVSPDSYVVFGVGMKQRDCYKVWEEGGKTPAVVFEYTSRGTRKEDENYKKILYEQVLRVPEYFLFDPKGEYLRPRLKGFRLINGVYAPLQLSDNRLFSEQLKLFMVGEGTALRFYDATTGELLRTHAEDIAILLAAEQRARQEQLRAEEAEEKLARLMDELEALKQRKPQS
jgi:Uma2 family endonuclease